MKKTIAAILCLFLLVGSPAFAAIAFVTSASGGDMSGAGSTTLATDTTVNLAAGRLQVVCLKWGNDNQTVSSVTDSAGNTYTDSGAGRIDMTSTAGYMQMFYTYNTSANATNTVTATWGGAVTYRTILVGTYSGVQTTSDPKDTGAVGTTASGTSVTSGAFTPAVAGEVAVACVARNGTTTATTADANYTKREERAPAANAYVNMLEDRLDAPVSSQTASASANTDIWDIIVRTFKATAASRRPSAPVMLGE